MKLTKMFTRQYSLLEHSLIDHSLLKHNSSVPEVYYSKVTNISTNGVVDICTSPTAFSANQQRIYRAAKKDPAYVESKLQQGLKAISQLSQLPFDLPKSINHLSNEQIIQELLALKDKFFTFSGFVEFTHHLGASNVQLSSHEVTELSHFHEQRKQAMMNYFQFLGSVTHEIAKKCGVNSEDLTFLTLQEIIDLLIGKLDPDTATKLQAIRRQNYIQVITPKKETVITEKTQFQNMLAEIKQQLLQTNTTEELRGFCVTKGPIIKGEVKKSNPER